ncbi:MAG: hypothetical protein JXR89_10595, partial [Deltaproteobacteria bacterium]|nr:hypothetical protein [Deltaproteobacteria bacterium]
MNEENETSSTSHLLAGLDPDELDFLQITALLDGSPPREELFRIIKTLRLAPSGGTSWDPEAADRQLRRLRSLGLISNNNRCRPEINETVARRPLERRALDLCRQLIRSSYLDGGPDSSENRLSEGHRVLRNFRLALYSHDFESLQKYLSVLYRAPYDPRFRHPYAALTMYPFDRQWFIGLPLPLQFAALDDCITHSLEDLVPSPEIDSFIREHYAAERPGSRPFILLYAHKLLLSGRLA